MEHEPYSMQIRRLTAGEGSLQRCVRIYIPKVISDFAYV